MGRFLIKLGFCLPVLMLMGAVNWTVDPGRFFVGQFFDRARQPYEAALIDDLRAGRPHHMTGDYNERLVLEQVFRDRGHIDVLILGSSIAKPISGELFPGRTCFNASVYGGEIEEAVAVSELAHECNVRPKQVVLQLQGFGRILGRRNGLSGFASVLSRARKRLGLLDEDEISATLASYLLAEEPAGQFIVEGGYLHPYDKLISPRYLQLSLRVLMQRQSPEGDRPNLAEPLAISGYRTIYPDGSVQWSSEFRARTPADIRRAFSKVLKKPAAPDDQRPIRRRCALFEALALDILNSGAQFDILLTPPISWFFERMESESAKAGKPLPSAETEEYIRSYAFQHGIRVFGSFDPRRAGVADTDYVDYCHLRRESIARLFKIPAAQE